MGSVQPACMCVSPASDRGGQEVPTYFEESARQSACMSSDRGVRKSRPFLKNQHAFNTVSLQVPLQPQTVRVVKSDPCLKDRLDSQFAGLQTHVQHSQFANVPLQRLN